MIEEVKKRPASRRGTSNANARGGSDTRRRRREWLIQTYRADVDLTFTPYWGGVMEATVPLGKGVAACRCYRCGVLLTAETLSVDRITPGCQGGTYKRTNIRPACLPCNELTGATVRRKPGVVA